MNRNGHQDVEDMPPEARRVEPVGDNGDEVRPPASAGVLAGFQNSAGNVGELALHAGTASAVAREEAEIKAALVLARSQPRNELAAYEKIIKSCQRPGFAAGAQYTFPRGGATVKGPSIDMARELARCWGNIRVGLRIVSADENTIHIKGYAHDLESNQYIEAEDKFARLVQRKGGWVKPDERDLRELVNRRGAILVRNCILQILPPDVIDDACLACDATNKKGAGADLSKDRTGTTRKLVLAFADVAVNVEMIERKLGHPLDVITDAELAELRTIYASMRDGNSKREEHFEVPGSTTPPGSKNNQMKDKLGLNKQETPPTPAGDEQGSPPAGGVPQQPAASSGPADGDTFADEAAALMDQDKGKQGTLIPDENKPTTVNRAPGRGRTR